MFSYDANGNMTGRTQEGVTWTQVFDAENRLVSVSDGTTTTTYVYDGSGGRLKRTVDDGTTVTTTLYVAGMEIEKTNGTESKRTVYYPSSGAFRVIGGSNAGLYFRHGDHLGSTSVLSNANGAKVAGSDVVYAPFGEVRSGEQPGLTDFGYTGQKHDDSTGGLMYYGARYYLPGIQHFVSADTMAPGPANPQAFNRYSYVLNNPVQLVDPSGHAAIPHNIPGPLRLKPSQVKLPQQKPSTSAKPGKNKDNNSSTNLPGSNDGGGGGNNGDGTPTVTIPTVADDMYGLTGNDDDGCRMDPCLKTELPLWMEGATAITTIFLDSAALVLATIRELAVQAAAIEAAGVSAAAGAALCAGAGPEAATVCGALGGAASYAEGYWAAMWLTYGPLDLPQTAIKILAVSQVALNDIAEDKTGWDPALNQFVVGGDTALITSSTLASVQPFPELDLGLQVLQTAYDVTDIPGGINPDWELRFDDAPGDEGIWGFSPTGVDMHHDWFGTYTIADW